MDTHTFRPIREDPLCLCFDLWPATKYTARGFSDATIVIGTNTNSYTLEGHEGNVWMVKFFCYNNILWLASTGQDRDVRIWNVLEGLCSVTLPNHTYFDALSISRDGELVLTTSKKEVHVWDMRRLVSTGLTIAEEGAFDALTAVDISLDKTQIAYGYCPNGTVQLLQMKEAPADIRTKCLPLPVCEGQKIAAINGILFHTDNRMVVHFQCGDNSEFIALKNYVTGQTIWKSAEWSGIVSLSLSRNCLAVFFVDMLIVSKLDTTVAVFSKARLPHEPPIVKGGRFDNEKSSRSVCFASEEGLVWRVCK